MGTVDHIVLFVLLSSPLVANSALVCPSREHGSPLFQLAAVFNQQPFDKRVFRSGKDELIYRAIGKVKCGEIAATGSIINSCTVLTNYHFWKECMKDGVAENAYFEFDHDGTGFQKRQQITFQRGGNSSSQKTAESLNDEDWAVFALQPCDNKIVPSFKICDTEITNETAGVRLAGLAWDRPDAAGLSVDEHCTIYPSSGRFKNFGHNCAARGKTSGAPIFVKQGADYCLLAIHAGCYSSSAEDKCEHGITSKFYDEQTFNFAIPIQRFKNQIPK